MTPRQLRYFLRIAETNGFAAAAKDLDVSQSALSVQIANLESELGVEVFFRKPRGVELTENGERLIPKAYEILRLIDSTVVDFQAAEAEPHGVVRIGMVPSINNVLARELVAAVEGSYANIELQVVSGPSRYLNELLQNRSLDLNIVPPDGHDDDTLASFPLFRETLYFVGSRSNSYPHVRRADRGNTIRFADVQNYLVLSTESQDGLGTLTTRYADNLGIKLTKKASFGQLLTDLNVIMAGEANMILPWSAIHHLGDRSNLMTARIVEPEIEREICLLSLKTRPVTHALLKTRSLIKTLVVELFRQRRSIGYPLFDATASPAAGSGESEAPDKPRRIDAA